MDIKLLQKFYRGECSQEEVQEVLGWFSSKAEKDAMMDQLKVDWTEFRVSEDTDFKSYKPAEVLGKIHDRIREEDYHEKPVISINRNSYYSIRVASIIVLAICASFLWHFMETAVSSNAEEGQIVVNKTPNGERRTVILEDGTEITLNAGSKLTYPAQFSSDKREIFLEGEAFFEVARDESRPFIVVTGDIQTTVLGTSFNVKAWEEEIEIAVASGKVKVSHQKEKYFLLPGKAVLYKEGNPSLSLFEFNEKEVLSWREGILYFREASYEEVEKKLERWYGIKIESVGRGDNGCNKDWQYTGSFERQSLDNVLLSIGYVKNFSYVIEGNLVKIKFKSS
jgi:transmembrane sensor